MRRGLVAGVVCLGMAGGASGASAAPITVNSTADVEVNDGDCTLREAVAAANTDSASGAAPGECAAGTGADTIGFSAAFDGTVAASTITYTGLTTPTITQPATINGGNCGTAVQPKPCVGVDPDAVSGFAINASNVTIKGIAFSGAASGSGAGVVAADAVSNPTIQGNWFGIRLDQTQDPNATGVLSGADGALIGGTTAGQRNVFAKSLGPAVRIASADDSVVRGNYFGLLPDGTSTAGLGSIQGVQVVQSGGDLPTGTVIGGPDGGTPGVCDGACNAIANTGFAGVDLGASELPAGQTTISGNFVGLDLAGSAGLGSGGGINVADADGVTVGGTSAADRNFVDDEIEIGDGASGATVRNNFIGLNPAGTARIGEGGELLVESTSAATIRGNRVAQDPNTNAAVSVGGANATLTGNVIGVGTGGEDVGGGTVAINVIGEGADQNAIGGTAAGDANVLGNAGAAAVNIVAGDDNVVEGNLIGTDQSGANHGYAGVGVEIAALGSAPATGNRIGGDTAASENVISNIADAFQSGDAIRIEGDGNDANLIGRNRGIANAGLFIELGANGPGNGAAGPNAGLEAPVINALTATSISGSGAAAGATIRVFATFTKTSGEIRSFVASAVDADGGSWAVNFPARQTGECLAVTQTDASGNTSELPTAQAIGGGSCTVPPPDTSIVSGPANLGLVNDATPTFGFSSTDPGASFECRFDAAAFAACSGPGASHTPVAPLAEGAHTFEVRARDAINQVDATPASRTFNVDTIAPPAAIDSGPSEPTDDLTPTFGFSSTDPGASFECRFDAAAFAACSGPGASHTPVAPLGEGAHTFEVRATDQAGNVGVPASRGFTVADPPETEITKGPRKKVKTKGKRAKVVFEFGSEPGVSFECSLDRADFESCASPLRIKVRKGKHGFEVRAIDAAGNLDPTPAARTWKVIRKRS